VRKLALTALLLAALAAGCGADEESKPTIPADTASALQDQLSSIQDRFDFPDGQACGDITAGVDPNTVPVQAQIDSVRDEEMRNALQDSFDRLFQLVERECAEAQQTETQPETDTTTTDTTTETEPPTTTETVPPTTDTTETVPPPTDTIPTETLPDGEDDGGGGFGPGDEG
jgi:metal-dependent amidase/aminoacylase/carboxypeptidase family protein